MRSPPAREVELDPQLDAIAMLGGLLDDLEGTRKANGNRVGAMKRRFGELGVFGVDAVQENLKHVEHEAELELLRLWRKHPLAPWAKGIVGVGEKNMARLVAAIGDPAARPNPAKLWAYCGVGDPARRRRSGMSQEELFRAGNPQAKMRVWVAADSCVFFDGKPDKNGRPRPRSPYRDVYDARKAATEGKLHDKPCVRCGPAGKPAPPGSEWSDAHRHADALRIVGKRLLLDVWVESRRLAGLPTTAKRGKRGGAKHRKA